MNEFVPLLSGRPLAEFTPAEFKQYVTKMYFKAEPVSHRKSQRELKVSAKVLKSGKISITTRREPKYVTAEEAQAISEKTQRPENEIFIILREHGIIIYTHDEAKRIAGEVDAIPF